MKHILPILFITSSAQLVSAQYSYFLDKSKTTIEILDTTYNEQLAHAADIFLTDSINFPKSYFNKRYHIEEDSIEIKIHDLQTQKSYKKINHSYATLMGDKSSDYWVRDTTLEIIAKDNTQMINGFECVETWVCSSQDTSVYWITDKLSFIRYSHELPWGLGGFVIQYDTKWHPSSKDNDIRLTFHPERTRFTKEQFTDIQECGSPHVYDLKPLDNYDSSCDSLPIKNLPKISRGLADAINDIALPHQIRYIPPIHQFLETTYIPQKIASYEKYKFGKSQLKYTLKGKDMELDWPNKRQSENAIKVKLGKNDSIKAMSCKKEKHHFENDTLYRFYKYKNEIMRTDWQHYDYENQILTSSIPYSGSGRNRKAKIKKFTILHFSADSLVIKKGDGVHGIDFRASTADQCKKYYSYNYNDSRQLISIFDERKQTVENNFCYYSNGLLKAQHSLIIGESQGNGYIYFDYTIEFLNDGKTKVDITKTWPAPMSSKSTKSYIFDKHQNIIWDMKRSHSKEIISTYHIDYKN